MGLILLSTVAVALVMLMMAVGVIFSNRCLRGSCGGRHVMGIDGQPLTCDTCPQRDRHIVPRVAVPRSSD
jgi:uncharacterized protein